VEYTEPLLPRRLPRRDNVTKDKFWNAVIDGKNSDELMEVYQQLSPEDQGDVQKEIKHIVQGFVETFKCIKKVILQIADIASWWNSLPEDVRKEFLREEK
jgi:hypothetical protein